MEFGIMFFASGGASRVSGELPVWITSSGNVSTFESAGRQGANLLTHLIGQDAAALAGKIARYRAALRESAGPAAKGKVALMLHTFLAEDMEEVRARVRAPFREYLRSAVSLEQLAALGGGAVSGGHRVSAEAIPPDTLEDLLDIAFERYFQTGSLLGTLEVCKQTVARLEAIGIDEIASLIDFIDDRDAILQSLSLMSGLVAAGQEH
jgi:natural product biosynthesis luciferase-like monooxygenase protein